MIRTPAAAIVAVSLLSLVATSATAQEQPKPKRDPNEIVCKKEEVLGSRLQFRKVCMTRAEWAEQRQIDRANVERSQTNTCQRQAGC